MKPTKTAKTEIRCSWQKP